MRRFEYTANNGVKWEIACKPSELMETIDFIEARELKQLSNDKRLAALQPRLKELPDKEVKAEPIE